MNDKNVYRDKFVPKTLFVGRVVLVVSLAVFFVPFLVTVFVYGVEPDWRMITKALIPFLVINLPWWISMPISYIPILGGPGTLLCFLSGNIANMRIPAAIAAQKAGKTEMGTEEGSVMSIIGLAMSVYVNLIILAFGVFAGEAVISALPPSISAALNYLLPALFGCIFAMFMVGNNIVAAVSIVSALILTVAYNKGLFAFVPFDASIFVMIIPIFLSILVALKLSKKLPKDTESEKSN